MVRRGLLALAVVLFASTAQAQGSEQNPAQPVQQDTVSQARALARESIEKLRAKDYATALDRASKAEQLYHAPSHLLFMAQALEGLGRLAEAADVYERLAAEPLPASVPEAFKKAQETARERLRVLTARVPSLLVNVRGAPIGKAQASLDDKPFKLASGVAVRVDAGKHVLKVTAKGYRGYGRTITLAAKGGVVVIDAVLEPLSASTSRSDTPGELINWVPDEEVGTSSPRPLRVPGFIALGIGGAGVVMGGITGAIFLTKLGDLKDRCPNNRCGPGDQADIEQTGTFGNLSTAGFVVGAAGLVAGGVMLLLDGGGASSGASSSGGTGIRVGPTGVGGTF